MQTIVRLISVTALSTVLLAAGCTSAPIHHTKTPADPSPSYPVTVLMVPDHATVAPGETFQLIVRIRVAGGYHIYGTSQPQGPFSRTAITLTVPHELDPIGDWSAPPPTVTRAGERVYTDSVQLGRLFRVRLNALPRTLSINGGLLCQACNDDVCFPAWKLPISASVAVMPKSNK